MAKLAYVSLAGRLYDELPIDYKRECRENMEVLRKMGIEGPEVWENVVKYVYDEFCKPPVGWFRYWDE